MWNQAKLSVSIDRHIFVCMKAVSETSLVLRYGVNKEDNPPIETSIFFSARTFF